ncbi:MAG TPA: NADPH-dependent F420 reductase [Candidatus Angelobacter sp.]|jgi:NADPH-dependent F420 reductase|nr:NADPH-dependent F420 reductase [Candidatus Angelobacter sp.]
MHAPVALLGGTGKLGPGLAMRFARAGVPVLIGSREAEKGVQAAAEASEKLRATGADFAPIEGMDNAWAAARAGLAVITVPYEGQAAMLPGLAESLHGKVVVSTAVPVRFGAVTGPAYIDVPEGSAAQQAAGLLPGSQVTAAFHSVSSATLKRLATPLDEHILVTGDDEAAKRETMELVRLLPGARPVDGGPLHCSRYTEQLTVLLLTVNGIYRTHAGVKLTNLPPEDSAG